ncbi:MAG: hypothetical protein HY319_05205 [Armatimonadetes bacterium]|nr:hypothetical protein [Armatimonadota bacterium]
MKTAWQICLVLILACAAWAEDGSGPLVVKAYRHYVSLKTQETAAEKDPTQRVYLRLDNPSKESIESLAVEGMFLNGGGDVLHTDRPEVKSLAPRQGSDVYLIFVNATRLTNLSIEGKVSYRAGGKDYVQSFTLTPEQPGFPKGYAP